MARFVLLALAAVCVVLPALATALASGTPFLVRGRVYCDMCRAGYETAGIKPIAGARVNVECKDRDSLVVKYSVSGVTNSIGFYSILVTGDRKDDICACKLVSSPMSECNEEDPNRNSAIVILTNNNGMVSEIRNANAMGFLRKEPMSGCTQILKIYEEEDV